MLQQFLLDRVQYASLGNTLHGLDRLAFHLYRQYQAGTHQALIDQYRTGAAVPGVATYLGSRQLQFVPQGFCQHLPRGTEEYPGLTVDGGLHRCFIQCCVHDASPRTIRSWATRIALATSTPTTWRR